MPGRREQRLEAKAAEKTRRANADVHDERAQRAANRAGDRLQRVQRARARRDAERNG